MKNDFGVHITYTIKDGKEGVPFMRRVRVDTRHEALLQGINELIQMSADQNFVPVIEKATTSRL